jgi:hypothetical protein
MIPEAVKSIAGGQKPGLASEKPLAELRDQHS